MASRGFSTSARATKALKWKLKGTTVQVDSYMKAVESAIDNLPPKFAAKAKVGIIDGDPHESPRTNDPFHASGKIGEGSANGKRRLSSFHAYPDGSVVFSDPALTPYNKGPDDLPASASGGEGAAAQDERNPSATSGSYDANASSTYPASATYNTSYGTDSSSTNPSEASGWYDTSYDTNSSSTYQPEASGSRSASYNTGSSSTYPSEASDLRAKDSSRKHHKHHKK